MPQITTTRRCPRSPARRRSACLLLVVAGLVIGLVASGCSTSGAAAQQNQAAVSSPAAAPSPPRPKPVHVGPVGAVAHAGIALNPLWPKTLTVVTDSVGLGLKGYLQPRMPGWQIDFEGWPAIMLHVADNMLQSNGQPVGSVVVLMVGYNSLWQKNRYRYDVWADKFDREADRLIATVKSLGAKKVVWVTLRESTAANSPANSETPGELDQYAWYFPYVNERLHALVKRHPDVALADWAAVSNRRGVTYDIIHLADPGLPLITEVIKEAVGLPPARVPGF